MTTNEWIDEMLADFDTWCGCGFIECQDGNNFIRTKQAIQSKLQEEYKRGFIEGGIIAINTPYKGQV